MIWGENPLFFGYIHITVRFPPWARVEPNGVQLARTVQVKQLDPWVAWDFRSDGGCGDVLGCFRKLGSMVRINGL